VIIFLFIIGIFLIQAGFPPEVFSSISVLLYPIKALVACFVGKFMTRGSEIRFIVFGYGCVILHSIM
jgi:hypothetical protein